MKITNRSRAGPARGFALLAAALLLMGTIATPALGDVEEPVDDLGEVVDVAELEIAEEIEPTEPVAEPAEEPEESLEAPDPDPPAASDEAAPMEARSQEAPDDAKDEPSAAPDEEPELTVETAATLETSPAADPCKTQPHDKYTDKHDVSPDNAVNTAQIMFDGEVIGTLTANDPLGTVTVAFFEGYEDFTIDLCVFGGTERQEYSGVEDEFVSTPLKNPAGETAGVSNFAWLVIPPPPPPDTITITLVKEWYDEEGELVEEPVGVDWGIELYVGADEEPSASLPGEDNVVEMELLEDEETGEPAPARYGIQENPAPAGWEAVSCEGLSDTEYVNEGTSALLLAGGADMGAFGASESGTHLVCNQREPEMPPAIFTLALHKLWLDAEGEPLDEAPEVEFTVTLSIDGEIALTVDEETDGHRDVTEVEYDTAYEVAEPVLPDGWELVTCPPELLEADELIVAHGVGDGFVALEGGDHVVCNQAIEEVPDEVLPVVIPKPEDEKEPEVAPTIEEKEVEEKEEVEVLAEVLDRKLPRTGADAGALALLAAAMLALGAAALAGTQRATARSRRP